MNIGIMGKFSAGKSSVARELEDSYDFFRVSMVSNLKAIVGSAYGTLDKSQVVEVTNSDGDTEHKTIRELLQDLGQAMKGVDRNIWLRWMLKDTEDLIGYQLVMDDVRLQFEVDALRDAGWYIVKLVIPEDVRLQRFFALYGRLPTTSELSHETEIELEHVDVDLVIEHDGFMSVEAIAERIVAVQDT